MSNVEPISTDEVLEAMTQLLGMDAKNIREVSMRAGTIEVYYWPQGKPGPLDLKLFLMRREPEET